MAFPYVYKLGQPAYSYSSDGKRVHRDKLRGLLRYAPLRQPRTRKPHCLFVYTNDDRDHANQLYLGLRNGMANFPGCKRLTGVALERDSVEAVKVPRTGDDEQAKAFSETIRARLAQDSDKPDFAFVLHSRQPNPLVQDPYIAAKVALSESGVPSQYVSWELLNSRQQFQYALSNIALSLFVKLGGVPWSVAVRRKYPTLVLGIGKAEIRDSQSRSPLRLIGYAVCTLSNGLYVDTSFFPPARDYEQFHVNLETGLKEVMDRMLSEYERVEKITIHVSQMERFDTIQVIRQTLSAYEKDRQISVPFELVRLTEDSDFSVLDLSNPGHVSEEGTVVALGQDHALIVTEGRREKAVWRGRKPVTLELRREYRSLPNMGIRDTIEDAFRLSSVNWRGFNAVTQPVSLLYARLLAQQVEKMSSLSPNIGNEIQQHESFNSVPWFI